MSRSQFYFSLFVGALFTVLGAGLLLSTEFGASLFLLGIAISALCTYSRIRKPLEQGGLSLATVRVQQKSGR